MTNPQRVGVCSICGGEVLGYRGAWSSVLPPPPDECSSCGAIREDEVIKMRPRESGRITYGPTVKYVVPEITHVVPIIERIES